MGRAPRGTGGATNLQAETIYKSYPSRGSGTITVPRDCKYVIVSLSAGNNSYDSTLVANISVSGEGTVLHKDSHWEMFTSGGSTVGLRSTVLVCKDVKAGAQISVEWRYL